MFWFFVKLSITTFGGGVAMIPMLNNELVRWISSSKIIQDTISLSLLTPGAFGSSVAAFAGMITFGPAGAAVCACGVVLPSAALSTVIGRYFYGFQKKPLVQGALAGIKPAVVGLIAATAAQTALQHLFIGNYKTLADLQAAWNFLQSVDWRAVVIFATALLCLVKFKVDPVFIILGCGALGLIFYILLPAII
jgi:chromate transporter